MALFQQSVIKKYLNDLDKEIVKQSWQRFAAHFHNTAIQANISNAKEEEYQEGFVRDLFVTVLGYRLKPQPDFNFVLEQKSTTDATKSDGAILHNGNVIAVIELKDTFTSELDKVEKQAFGYKHQHKNCEYIITSNFEKLRFYINDATERIEFNLFKLTEAEFALLYTCLACTQLLAAVPQKMKQASVTQEESVTKKLYADYSAFRQQLFANMAAQNQQYDKLLLFKKTQKLLDRFLFIFFAEDRLLLPPNSIREILTQWEQLKELDNYVPLYSRFKKYFGYLNTGYEGKHHEIFAYNGGLFLLDEILDSIQIDDTILFNGCKALSEYDFESEVDVNILGHIFEHSLNEIEEMQAQLEGTVIEKTKTKRKKDGVFYTPRYITKYIVENTVGELCRQQKEAMGIVDDSFTPQKRKANTKQLQQLLDDYRNWLLQLTICDPACGSGAFLNQALEFLITEHRYVDELKAKLFGDALVLSDVETEILEHNLFGVDINEEAVEIARLSLWLRTARKGRKLNNLNKNIKCGNSLIDDPVVAGDKAFNWQNEFAHVFEKGGFDVVIGNPPYVDIKALQNDLTNYLFKKFETSNNRINLFAVFIEQSLTIMKEQSRFSFIIPSSLLTQESYSLLRNYILNTTSIQSIVRLPNESFGGSAGEVKVDTIILTLKIEKATNSEIDIIIYKGFDRINEISVHNAIEWNRILQSEWLKDANKIFRINVNDTISALVSKIETNTHKLVDCAEFCLGLTPYDKYRGHTKEQIDNRVFHSNFKKDDTFMMLLAGNDVKRYFVEWGGEEWISYGDWLGAPRERKFFIEKRILIKQIIDWTDKRIWAALTAKELYNAQNAFNLIAKVNFKAEFLIALINSRLMSFYLKKKFLEEFKDRFQKILIKDCKEFPIKVIPEDEQVNFEQKVNTILFQNSELYEIQRGLLHLLQSKYEAIGMSKKLQNWPSLSFKDFLKELSKQKIKLSLAEEAEWLNYFEEQKAKANAIQQVIKTTDKEIDRMVYALYELTEEEIKIVEGV